MKMYKVTLKTYKLEEMKKFYTDVLEMELINSSKTSFSVKAGETELIFNKVDTIPFYHLCFRSNNDFFSKIFHKLNKIGVLLSDKEGNTLMNWEGNEAYFTDPDGNILEMLEREYLGEGDVPSRWYDICEVGLPLRNIKETQAILSNFLFDEEKRNNDDFAFYGNKLGHLVLVKEGRFWYPTKRKSIIYPLEVVVSGKVECEFKLLDYPYFFKVTN